jgi:hypothetical protein
MATRAKIKPVNLAPDAVKAQAATEAKRKRESKAKLREATTPAKPKPEPKPAPVVDQTALAAKKAAEHEAYLQALREDAAALGRDPDEYIAEQLVEPAKQTGYVGPMLALRAAAKGYVKGKNGNPHCGDDLASLLDGLTRDQVVGVLIIAMKLPGNPYPHLNPGQQSMNLRNKARGQLKNGLLKSEDIQAAIATITK